MKRSEMRDRANVSWRTHESRITLRSIRATGCERWALSQSLGVPVLRKEDPALLSGRGRYADDLPVPDGTLNAHVLRSPHAHAKIARIDASAALAQDGVWAVITGED